ncbi:IS1381, transposase OrfA [Streptococcus pneumoniae]|nr:IS1381, transposase OrfA [Streptococcus pneumoniae]
MNYEASKQLTDARFKRLVGVQRTTFEEMLAVLKTAYQLKHAKGGRKPKLSLEDLLMATLQYVRNHVNSKWGFCMKIPDFICCQSVKM